MQRLDCIVGKNKKWSKSEKYASFIGLRKGADVPLCRCADLPISWRQSDAASPDRLVRNIIATVGIRIRTIKSNNFCNDYEYDHIKTNDKNKYGTRNLIIETKVRAFARIIRTQHQWCVRNPYCPSQSKTVHRSWLGCFWKPEIVRTLDDSNT